MKEKNDFTLDDVDYTVRVISIEDNVELLDKLEDLPHVSSLTDEEKKVLDYIWKMVEFVCGGKKNADFVIMYLVLDQGYSQREVAEMLNVSHMAINKRYKKIINKLKFLLGQKTETIPYRKSSGPKEKI